MANISATAKAVKTVTAQEAAQGFCVVHVSWISPFYDTNYVATWAVEDTGNLAGGPSLNLAPGDKHNVSPTGFDATVYLTSFPVVQAKLTKSNISVPVDFSTVLQQTTLYNITLYYQSLGLGSGAASLSPTISWTDPQDNPQSLAYPYLGPISGDLSDPLQNYSIPFLALKGSALEVTTAFVGTPFAYNIGLSIESQPTAATDITGTIFIVHAMASHR